MTKILFSLLPLRLARTFPSFLLILEALFEKKSMVERYRVLIGDSLADKKKLIIWLGNRGLCSHMFVKK